MKKVFVYLITLMLLTAVLPQQPACEEAIKCTRYNINNC